MESAEAKIIHENDWGSLLHHHRPSAIQARPRWDFVILVIAVFVHVGFIGYLFSWRATALQHALTKDGVLEVTFIDRVPSLLAVESPSALNKNQNTKPVSRRFLSKTNTETTVTPSSIEEAPNIPLRLTLNADEWSPAPIMVPKNPLKRQFIAMPGRAEPFIQGIKLRDKLTPEQKLKMIGKLFGAVEYDPCKEAKNRLASGGSQNSEFEIEWNLRAIEHHCRP